jgi:predicted phosphodiesterase
MSVELRVAVVTDVHGNLQALRAVLDDIERRGPFDRLIAGGDYCLSGPQPAEAFDLTREHFDTLLKGNTDRDIVDEGAEDPDLGNKKRASIAWTRDQLGPERIEELDGLAFEERVEPPGGALHVVHANPRDLDRHIFPDMPELDARELIGDLEADVLVFGHLHIPYRRRIGELRLFDVAACGLPCDGDRRAAWGSFGWSSESGWRGTIHRTPYDHGTTALRMIESGMPHAGRRVGDLLRATYD